MSVWPRNLQVVLILWLLVLGSSDRKPFFSVFCAFILVIHGGIVKSHNLELDCPSSASE